jgi:ABC-type antimicrobial peptide transport system permease subunit
LNLRKDVKDLYKENYELLKKEIEKDYLRWKDLLCSWTGRINIVKTGILPKATNMFKVIVMKIPMAFITEIDKSILKFIW